jgi:hypothetical protein
MKRGIVENCESKFEKQSLREFRMTGIAAVAVLSAARFH